MYTVTAKLAHGFYHVATLVDYNLFIDILILGDVQYQAHTRLHKG